MAIAPPARAARLLFFPCTCFKSCTHERLGDTNSYSRQVRRAHTKNGGHPSLYATVGSSAGFAFFTKLTANSLNHCPASGAGTCASSDRQFRSNRAEASSLVPSDSPPGLTQTIASTFTFLRTDWSAVGRVPKPALRILHQWLQVERVPGFPDRPWSTMKCAGYPASTR